AETGEPLPGVNVLVKGTTHGASTDIDGKYVLETENSEAVLVFTFVGYLTQEIPLNSQSVIDVQLAPASKELQEVVVVGYGVQKKAHLTGAIADISGKDILTTRTSSLAAALAGKVPGLQIRQNNGQPGSFNTNINVRGMGTPLFVIDGVVRNDGAEFQKLNPQDIESITVLKDASAAIYGINASNGVILVTTREGKKGALHVSYDGLYGVSAPTRHTQMMTPSQYWEIRNENDYHSRGTPYFSAPDELNKAKNLPYTDWYGAVFKNQVFQQQHNLTLEGGNDLISTFMNFGFQTDNGLLRSGDIGYQKVTFRNRTVFNASKNFKVELGLAGYKDLRKQPGTWDDAFFFINKAVHGLIPSESVYANNNESYYNRPRPLTDNPVLMSQSDLYGYGEWREGLLQSTIALTYAVPKAEGLKLKLQGAYDFKNAIRTRVQKRTLVYEYAAADNKYRPHNTPLDPSIREENNNTGRANLQAHIVYNTKIAQVHEVGATLVGEAREDKERYVSAQRFYQSDLFTVDNIDRAPTTNQQAGGWTSLSTYLSLIGRFNYAYKSKYLFEFAFRRDGSYRYSPDKRWGFFPVGSVGWQVSEEKFIKSKFPALSDLKLRASYGKTAQDAGNAFQFLQGYRSYNGYVMDAGGNFSNGFESGPLLNSNLTWTTSKTINLAVDIGLWSEKLNFTFEIYRRNRSGLLVTRAQALPNTFGAVLPQENLESDRIDGYEFMLGHRNKINNFNYGVSANMNVARAKMIYQERAAFQSSWDRWRNGAADRWQDIGWGYQTAGQYQNFDQIRNGVIETVSNGNSRTLPGDYIHEDVNGDGVISDKDRMPLFWNGQPKLIFGVTAYFNWKGLDFNMVWQGAGKYSVKYNEILGNVLALDYSNSPAMYYDRWHLKDVYNPDSEWVPGKYPATRRLDSDNGANRLESNVQRVDATYARLKTIELGYTVRPYEFLKKIGVSKLRFYVNAFNLVVISNKYLKNFDPEITDGNGFQYPLSKSFYSGVNITF
ncbi:MAG: SusC/RagA family TonB-linked outer membrane protein, partial [Candidatus Nephrothrix sp. EaCA]